MIPQVNKIAVFHNCDLVGSLQMTPDGRSCAFEYSREWLANGFALSPLELPLTSDIVFSEPDKFDRNFAVFEDSMPDGYGLYLIDRILRKSGFQLRNLTPLQKLAVVEERGGMLTVRSFRRIGYVVSRCQAPYTIPADETEVLGMVILVVAYKIEHHPSIHFLNLKRILSQISSQGKKILRHILLHRK